MKNLLTLAPLASKSCCACAKRLSINCDDLTFVPSDLFGNSSRAVPTRVPHKGVFVPKRGEMTIWVTQWCGFRSTFAQFVTLYDDLWCPEYRQKSVLESFATPYIIFGQGPPICLHFGLSKKVFFDRMVKVKSCSRLWGLALSWM